MERKLSPTLEGLFYVISFALSGWMALQLLGEPFLRGWDSYFYALRTQAWFVQGAWQLADGNMLHLLLTPFHWLGIGVADALRLWQALSFFLLSIPFILLLRQFRSAVWATVLFAWFLFSPVMMYVDIALMKTMAFLICFAWAFYFSVQKKPNWLAWAIFSAVAILLHRAAVPYVAVSAVYMLAAFYGSRGYRALGWILLGLLVGATAYLAFWPSAISAADLSRISAERLTPGLISLIFRYSFPPEYKRELILALCVMFALVVVFIHRRDKRVWYPVGLLAVSFFPTLGTEALCLGERFGILFPFFSLLSCAFLLRKSATGLKSDDGFSRREMFLVAAALLVVGFGRLDRGHPITRNQPYDQYARLSCHLSKHPVPMLVSSKGFNHFYTFTTGAPAFSFEPEDHWDSTQVWRVVQSVSPQELAVLTPPACQAQVIPLEEPECTPLAAPMFLVREDCYRQIRRNAREQNGPAALILFNDVIHPNKKRSLFLYKKHPHTQQDEQFPACPPPGCR